MLHKPQTTTLIESLFYELGDSQTINETLWDMFQASISNPTLPTDHSQSATFAFIYKRLTEFIAAIEPPQNPTKSSFSNN